MTLPIYTLPDHGQSLEERLSRRSELFDRSLLSDVARIFDDVCTRGDAAVRDATATFDSVGLDAVRLPAAHVAQCAESISAELRSAIEVCIRNIREVNDALMPEPRWQREIRPGTIVGEQWRPLDAVGLWVPARKGPLISTALMLAVAAKAAGVPRIVVAMPPGASGAADEGTIAAARLAGAHEFLVGNGVAIIAALTLGTESIREADGIFGPGPGAIAAAMATAYSYGKRTVMGIGPTDSMILADESADPTVLAHDLINEAEHGPDSCSALVTTCADLAGRVAEHVAAALPSVPEERRAIIEHVFGPEGMGCIVLAPDLESACGQVNAFAPEHLMVACDDATTRAALDLVKHAGEILIGHHTPFSAGNYAIGITAVLPTNGFARGFSGVTCRDMLKCSTVGSLDAGALQDLLPTIATIAKHEGLPCHGLAAQARARA